MIAVDIHDTVLTYTTECIRLYGWPISDGKSLRGMWPQVDWDAHFSLDFHREFLKGLTPFENAIESLKLLTSFMSVTLITATRSGGPEEAVTRASLARFGLPTNIPILFLGSHDEKIAWVLENRDDILYLIDDYGPIVERVVGDTIIPVILMDAPWNRYLGKLFMCYRVSSWVDVVDLLNRLGAE